MAPVSWSFTTEAAPALTSTTPAAGATNVATNGTVQAVFNKAVVASTISFTLKDAANNPISGAAAYNASTNTATFTPSALLATATTFTATVSGAKDSSGNTMAPVSWSFTTEAAPALTSTTPASGATNVATTSTVQAVFNKAIQSSTLSFVLKDASGATVASTVAYNASTNTATLTPNAVLADATTYTATVSGAKDTSGNTMVPVSWSFTTAAGAVPAVTSTSPTSGATNVATNSTVQAVFNKAVVASTISFTLKDAANNPVSGTVSYNATTNTATFTPSALLGTSTTYTATVSGAQDSSGNTMTPVSWSFTTEAAPALTSQTPASGATNVATTSTVQAVFNKAIQSSTLSFVLKDAGGATVASTVAYNASTNTATLTPNALLATATTFTATVSGAKDTSGNLMAPVSWSFTTEAAPALTSTTPAAGATNVATNTTVQAVFNKAVVASTISFTLKDAANNPISGAVAYNASTNTATFTPSALLATATTFTATVSGAKDASGNLMAPVSWSFTTEAAPAVTSTVPAAGATNVGIATTVQAVFNKPVVASSISFVLKDSSGATVASTVAYNATTNTATLTPSALLVSSTVYTATISGVQDASGNVLAAPVSWSFTTGNNVWTQSTAADFNAGTQSNTLVTDAPKVGVQLLPAFQDNFTGTSLSSSWSTQSYAGQGGGPLSLSVSGGLVSVQGGAIASTTTYNSNTAVEGRIQFGAAAAQDFGLATAFNVTAGNSWVAFSTKGTTTTLYARVNRNGTLSDISLGALPTGFHVYTIRPTGSSFQFYVDGVLQTTIKAAIPASANLKLTLSSFNGAPTPAIQAEWLRVATYPSSGTFTSSVFDAGQAVTWGLANWTSKLPTNTTLTVQTRSGNTATPDGSWSAWSSVSNGGTIASPAGRYLQYQVTLTTTDPTVTPTLFSISFTWA
jgi:methionine-rich copper-binding protein CopC